MNKRFTQYFNDGFFEASVNITLYSNEAFAGWATVCIPCMLANTDNYSVTRPVGFPLMYVVEDRYFILPVKSMEKMSYGYFAYIEDTLGAKDATALDFYECVKAQNTLKVFVVESDEDSIA